MRTYLQIASLDELRPARTPLHRATVQQALRCAPAFYRFLYTTIGRDYHWTDRLGWTDEEIRTYLSQRSVQLWVMYVDGAPAGFFELRRDEEGAIELAYFGLLREYLGQGLGGYLLTEAVMRAFAQQPARVWVHTCTLDHPAALHNYLERGFHVVREEAYTAQLRP